MCKESYLQKPVKVTKRKLKNNGDLELIHVDMGQKGQIKLVHVAKGQNAN